MERLYKNNINFYEVDCDIQERLCTRMNITSYPTVQLRAFGDWNKYYLPLKTLNGTLASFPKPCKFPEHDESCHPKTKRWISEHTVSDFEEFEADFVAEQEMYNIGVADLTKHFIEKKMMMVQLREWYQHSKQKDSNSL